MGLRDAILRRVGLVPQAELLALQSKMDGMMRRQAQKRAESAGTPFSMGRFDYEANNQLTGSNKWITLDKMENDPAIKAALRTNTLPLLNAEWMVQPASDSPKDIEVAEFCEANYLCKSSDRFGREYWCSTSWKLRLAEKLQFLRDGFSLTTYTLRRAESKLVYHSIKWLEPSTVDPYGWQMDEADNLIEIQRTFKDPMNRYRFRDPISADLVNLVVWDMKGARLEGRQFVRSMYGAWMRKDLKQHNAAIWTQKAGPGVPIGHYPSSGWTENDIDRFEEVVKASRGTSPAESWGYFPKGADGDKAEIEYIGSDADLDRSFSALIDQENAEISRAGGIKSEMLGETQTGSRAVAGVQGQREMLLVEAVASVLCDQINHGVANLPGELERLVDLNYPGVDAYPELVCSKIDPKEGLADIDALVKAKQAGLIPSHPDVRKQITERFGLNLPDEAYEVEEPPPMAPFLPGQEPTRPPNDETEKSAPADDEDQQAAASLAARDDFKARIAEMLVPVEDRPRKGAGFRGRNRLELEVVSLADVQASFRAGERDTLTDLRAIHRDMIEDLMGRLRAGKITTRNLDGQRRSKYRGEKKAVARLEQTLTETGEQGRRHVRDEIGRQE